MRRLINAVLLNHEYDIFETRVTSLVNVTDAFLLQESKYTTFGEVKELNFRKRFQKGWLSDFHDKFACVYLSNFTDQQRVSGWSSDIYIREHLGIEGMKLLVGTMDDDLFLLNDADELPSQEPLLFLKLYDGYTEPIAWNYRWNVYRFYWTMNKPTRVIAMCTVGMLRDVYKNDASTLRGNRLTSLNAVHKTGRRIQQWEVGSRNHLAGYHCSWCYDSEGIRVKLISAQADDKPRWGDYPEKTEISYIERLIETGSWFDGSRLPMKFTNVTSDDFDAPKYMMDNYKKFKYLMEPNTNKTEDEETEGEALEYEEA